MANHNGDWIKDNIFRHLRLLCKLVQALDGQPVKPVAKFARVYGPREYVRFNVLISTHAVYPDYEGFDPVGVLREKPCRLKLERSLEGEISAILVGYKVDVKIDNT